MLALFFIALGAVLYLTLFPATPIIAVTGAVACAVMLVASIGMALEPTKS